VKEFQANPDNSGRSKAYRNLDIPELEADFEGFVSKLISHAQGENLPEGYVPCTELWLVDGSEFIGNVSIRHRLTEYLETHGGHIGYDIRPSQRGKGYGSKLLELALPLAKDLGITRVLIMCDSKNEASRKIIEKNGAVPRDGVTDSETGETTLRFWIENK